MIKDVGEENGRGWLDAWTALGIALGLGLLVALGAIYYKVTSTQVPYSAACFHPDEMARSFCHKQFDIAVFKAQLQAGMLNPVRMRQHKALVLLEYERLLSNGATPEEIGLEPSMLVRIIDQAYMESYGTPI